MRSPLPIIANVALRALSSIRVNILIYYKYVDDIILTVPIDRIDDILTMFKNFHNRLQFTVEIEKESCLSFLLLIKIDNNKIIIDWFHKKTFSGCYLSFYFNYSTCHKIGAIYSLMDKSILLSSYLSPKEFRINY